MKKLVKGALFFAIIGTVIVGCEKEESSSFSKDNEVIKSNKESSKSDKSIYNLVINQSSISSIDAEFEDNDFSINYVSNINSSISESTIEVLDKTSNLVVFENSIIINLDVENYKFYVKDDLLEIANNLTINITEQQLITIRNLTVEFAKQLFLNVDNSLQYEESVQGMFYQATILLMQVRKNEAGSTNCNCSTYGGYLSGDATFACTEDMIYTTDFVNNYYSNSNLDSISMDTLGFDSVIAYTTNNPNQLISQKKIDDIVISNMSNPAPIHNPSGAPIYGNGLSGRDPGCVGSYDGPCWFSHPLALLHDIACECCRQWHCGWACNREEGCWGGGGGSW